MKCVKSRSSRTMFEVLSRVEEVAQLPTRVKPKKKFTGSKISAIFCKIASRITTQNGSRTLEMDSNQLGAVGGIIWGPFPGSWTHLGASRGLKSQKRGPYLAIFGPSLTPPANLVNFFWSKMACTGVPHIVLHVSCRTRTSGGYFWPSEVRFRGILAHFDQLIL